MYEGWWINDTLNGKGRSISGDGAIYDGQWKNGKRHGTGKTQKGGVIYKGDFFNGKRHGQGKYSYADKSTYEGEIR